MTTGSGDIGGVRRPAEAGDEVDVVAAGALGAMTLADSSDRGVLDHEDTTDLSSARQAGGADDLAAPGSMSSKVRKGASWSATSKLGGQAVQFAAGLVLARLLTPADYGTLASIYVITGFAILFFELGLGSTVIALRHPTQKDLSTVFWINALAGVAFTLLLVIAGPFVAALFDDPKMRVLTPLVGLTFLFGLGSVHNGLLQRELRFKSVATISLVSTVVSFGATIAFAAGGLGVYALAVGPIVASIVNSVVSWAIVPWRPTSFISRESLPRLWAFSGGQLGFNVVNYWSRNADNFLIARFVSDIALGLYNKSYQLMLTPVQQVSQVLGQVMFPALAAMRGDRERVARGYRRAVRLINVATVPALAGMAATAPGLIPFLWGDQWTGAVRLLMILSIAGIPQCLTTSVGWLFQSQNRTKLMFWQGLVSSAVGVAMMVVGLLWGGVEGVAWAVLVKAWLAMPPTLGMAVHLVGLRARVVLRENAPVTVVAGVMFALVWFFPTATGLDRTASLTLGFQVLLGAGVFAVGAAVFLRPTVVELFSMVRRRRAV